MMGAPKHKKDSVKIKRLSSLFEQHLHQLLHAFPTLFTSADIQHARAQAVSCRDTEARIGRVHGQIGKHLARGTEAIPRDPLHVHILRVHSVQRPWKQSQMMVNLCRHKYIVQQNSVVSWFTENLHSTDRFLHEKVKQVFDMLLPHKLCLLCHNLSQQLADLHSLHSQFWIIDSRREHLSAVLTNNK